MICIHCGKEIPDGAIFCRHCGEEQSGPVRETSPSQNKKVEEKKVDEKPPADSNDNKKPDKNDEEEKKEPVPVKTDHKAEKDANIDKAIELIEQKSLARAITFTEDLIEQWPDEADYWALNGKANEEWGDLDKAINSYKQTLRLNPQQVFALNNLGACLFEREEFEESYYYFTESAKCVPDVEVCFSAVAALVNFKGLDAAIDQCLEYLEIVEDKERLNYKLAQCYSDKALSYFVPGIDGDKYLIEKEAVKQAREYVLKALYAIPDKEEYEEDKALYRQILSSCNDSEAKVFQGFLCKKAVIWTVIGAIFLLFAPAIGVFIAAFGIIGIVASRVPQWRVNYAVMNPGFRYGLIKAIGDLFGL